MNRQEFLFLRRTETPKTFRLLEMFPEEKKDLKPGEKSRSALELATVFLNEERANLRMAEGQAIVPTMPPPDRPGTIAEAVAKLRQTIDDVNARVEAMSDDEFNQPIEFFGRTLPRGSAMTLMLLDHIHHRGQFTVYSRLAGARVPQIYGPSADEPLV